jgi:hypothetical protein|tara:strand:+ start:404 stop:517 length:114 start_codon:yes stop_codon:yes gene_type:complete
MRDSAEFGFGFGLIHAINLLIIQNITHFSILVTSGER